MSITISNRITKLKLFDYLAPLLNSYSEIFFIHGKLSGFIIILISFLNYNTAIAGLLSVVTAYLFANFIGFKNQFLSSGYYTYNPLLVGLSIGYLFQISWLTLSFIAISSVLTFLLTIFMANIFYYYFRLQVLSIPFVIVSSLVYLAAARYSNLFVTSLYSHDLYAHNVYLDFTFLPDAINAFFRAMGAIIFMPNAVSGLLISILILFNSRIIMLLALLGFFIGTFANGMFIGSINQSLTNFSNFNYILIAIAIGGIFNIPSIKSYVMAGIAVLVSTILLSAVDVFWAQYSIPIFTLPFTIVTLSFVYALNIVGYPNRPSLYKSTPEETLDYFLITKDRFPDTLITVALPFNHTWNVWQDFDGKWTHQGIWRHAYDFVITDQEGKNHRNDGKKLEDYYAYKQPILSPVRGRVIRVISNLPDNPIGTVDSLNNWGNLIVIQDERGYFIEISHFSNNSLCVYEGDWVEPGTKLGLCGNSGYSPQPHIHIQAQVSGLIGAATQPFTFIHYTENERFHAHGRPNVGSSVTPLSPIAYYEQATTFILDEVLNYAVYRNKNLIEEIELKVKMDIDGTFYFSRGDSRLYFGKREGVFFTYHMTGNDFYLSLFYQCISSIPLNNSIGMQWVDTLSSSAILSKSQSSIASLLNAVTPHKVRTKGRYKFISDSYISGNVKNEFFGLNTETSLELDPYLKFKTVSIDNYDLRRVQHKLSTSYLPN